MVNKIIAGFLILLLNFVIISSPLQAKENINSVVNLSDYKTIKTIVEKDPNLEKAANLIGEDRNLIATVTIIEQLRGRTIQKNIFDMQKKKGLLVAYTSYAYGVSGVKEEIAKRIEIALKNPSDKYYLGKEYESVLNSITNKNRISKLTDARNFYWQYLYTGLALKMLKKEWNSAGYSIDNKPEITATLFNLGFVKSKPKKNPDTGGALIKVSGVGTFYFGDLAKVIYPNLN